MKLNHLRNSPIFLVSVVLIAGLFIGLVIATEIETAKFNHDYLHLGHETVTLKIDGKVVSYTENLINNVMYDYVICKIFNDTTACSTVGAQYTNFSNACQIYTGGPGPALGNNFYSKNLCSSIGISLSQDTNTPTSTNPICGSVVNGFNVVPIKATTSHSINTNTIILSGSWTASGTINSISKICLWPYNDKNANVVIPADANALAADLLSPFQSVSSGQAISAQWTFSF